MPTHTVKQGECLSSIARQYGFGVDTIWDHADNKALRDKRKSPNVLYVGDLLVIPDKGQKQMQVTSNQTHQFKVKAGPPELRMKLLAGGKPVNGAAYTVEVDGAEIDPKTEKKTDGEGLVAVKVSQTAAAANVSVAKMGTVFQVKLGHLDPASEETGVLARLRQLGYHPWPGHDAGSSRYLVALWLFQNNKGLKTTSAADDATIDALKKAHGL